MRRLLFLLTLFPLLSFAQNKKDDTLFMPKPYVELKHPAWSRNATIYEVNIRQYTPEGTFSAFEKHLPRLKDMGIDILWLMPVHPIGEEKRKGAKGSYYSVKDYYGVNPEFGSEEDFQHLVNKIHSMGMYVIIDWVANHSAWDNPLVKQHPEWYTKTDEGKFQPTPWYDWDDVIDFDYNQLGIRNYMTEALKFWVKKYNIDGYRCDVAGFIPVDFWENVRYELDKIKPVFMLAEWESRDLHKKAFDMTYSWSLWDKMHNAVQSGKFWPLVEYFAHDVNTFPEDAYRMTFTDNHDKNSWEGNPVKNFGAALPLCMVTAATVKGMPLVYSGQEAGLDRSLAFFEKDTIEWKQHSNAELYKKLFALKHRNKALWNGTAGGDMIRIVNNLNDKVISFYREKDGDRVVAMYNYSNMPVTVKLNTRHIKGKYGDLFSGEDINLNDNEFKMNAWGYRVLELYR